MSTQCFCGKNTPFENCCKPVIEKQREASDPETLMRSRYSAYVTQNFDYILNTYAEKQRRQLTLKQLSEDAEQTRWLKLVVEEAINQGKIHTVTFSAFYHFQNQFYKLHERSNFTLEQGQWRYTDGEIFDDSGPLEPQRNMPCFCGSGAKFKRCCGK